MNQSSDSNIVAFQVPISPCSPDASISFSPAVTEDSHSESSGHNILVIGAEKEGRAEQMQEVSLQASRMASNGSSDASGLDGMFERTACFVI